MQKKLCVFPSDPLQAYVSKGEIKPRYFNPQNCFHEVHIMNPSYDDIELESVKELVGDADIHVHAIGKINIINLHFKKNYLLHKVREIRPDIIRSYNPLIQGWLAAFCSKKLRIPYFISLHGDYQNEIEKEYLTSWKLVKFLKLWLTRTITQKSISFASVVTCIHKGLVPYAKKCGGKNVEVVYNRVNVKQFENVKPVLNKDKLIILNVGNFRKIKNQECLIRAVKGLDVYLVLIGRGEMLTELKSLAKKLGLEKKVIFIDAVKHSEIQNYYASAKIFAMPLKGNGITIPTLEAMASGCILVVAEPNREKNEPYDPVTNYVRNDPQSFRQIFQEILNNEEKFLDQTKRAKEVIHSIDETSMEKKEAELYEKLFSLKKKDL